MGVMYSSCRIPPLPISSMSGSFQCPGPANASSPACPKPMLVIDSYRSWMSPVVRHKFPPTSLPHLQTRSQPYSHKLRSEEHTSELQSRLHLVCRLLLEKNQDQEDGDEERREGDGQRGGGEEAPAQEGAAGRGRQDAGDDAPDSRAPDGEEDDHHALPGA